MWALFLTSEHPILFLCYHHVRTVLVSVSLAKPPFLLQTAVTRNRYFRYYSSAAVLLAGAQLCHRLKGGSPGQAGALQLRAPPLMTRDSRADLTQRGRGGGKCTIVPCGLRAASRRAGPSPAGSPGHRRARSSISRAPGKPAGSRAELPPASPGTPGGSRGFGDAGRPPPRSLPSARGVPPASPGRAARRVAAEERTPPKSPSAGLGRVSERKAERSARLGGQVWGREGRVGLARFSERSGELAPRNALFVKCEVS